MEIGVVKDLKQGEARVGMTPENVKIPRLFVPL